MGKADERRKNQIEFLACGGEIEVGNAAGLPLDISDLLGIDEGSGYVEAHIGSGLTADVYKLKINGEFWNLKKKRGDILVKNIDGQTSFLNEVQRRRDFERLKKENPAAYSGIVDTAYASLKNGIILSPWIDGGPIKKYSRAVFSGLFNTLFNIEIAGLFEYDLCPGNLLLQNDGTVRLFDFGYMYPYDPLTEYNPDGLQFPIFHPVERFESRSFMQYLMDVEHECGMDSALSEFRAEKEEALNYYRKKAAWLEENAAAAEVLSLTWRFIDGWEAGLAGRAALEKLYAIESFRSFVLDIHDDVGGKSCTRETLKKIEKVIHTIGSLHPLLIENQGLFWGDEKLSRHELLARYGEIKKLVVEYQLEK